MVVISANCLVPVIGLSGFSFNYGTNRPSITLEKTAPPTTLAEAVNRVAGGGNCGDHIRLGRDLIFLLHLEPAISLNSIGCLHQCR